jgi:hypothetical protein
MSTIEIIKKFYLNVSHFDKLVVGSHERWLICIRSWNYLWFVTKKEPVIGASNCLSK